MVTLCVQVKHKNLSISSQTFPLHGNDLPAVHPDARQYAGLPGHLAAMVMARFVKNRKSAKLTWHNNLGYSWEQSCWRPLRWSWGRS